MSRDDKLRLEDIREACRALGDLAARGEAAFKQDSAVQLAMERLLEIIGEAANVLSPSTIERYDGVPWRDVTRLRILLAHHYHRVDPSQIWTIVTTEIPLLLDALADKSEPA